MSQNIMPLGAERRSKALFCDVPAGAGASSASSFCRPLVQISGCRDAKKKRRACPPFFFKTLLRKALRGTVRKCVPDVSRYPLYSGDKISYVFLDVVYFLFDVFLVCP